MGGRGGFVLCWSSACFLSLSVASRFLGFIFSFNGRRLDFVGCWEWLIWGKSVGFFL